MFKLTSWFTSENSPVDEGYDLGLLDSLSNFAAAAKSGESQCRLVCDVLKQRAAVEEKYASGLAAIASQKISLKDRVLGKTSSSASGTLSLALDLILADAGQQAESHLEIAAHIKQLETSLRMQSKAISTANQSVLDVCSARVRLLSNYLQQLQGAPLTGCRDAPLCRHSVRDENDDVVCPLVEAATIKNSLYDQELPSLAKKLKAAETARIHAIQGVISSLASVVQPLTDTGLVSYQNYNNASRAISVEADVQILFSLCPDVEPEAEAPPPPPSLHFKKTLEEEMEVSGSDHPSAATFPSLFPAGGSDCPVIMRLFMDGVLQQNGCATEGIFRINATEDKLQTTRALVSEGDFSLGFSDPYVPASLLKMWLRELAEPLIPNEHHDRCVLATKGYDGDPTAVLACFAAFSPLHQRVIRRLITFFRRFLTPETQRFTKMTAQSLSIVCGPCFFRCPLEALKDVVGCLQLENCFVRVLLECLPEEDGGPPLPQSHYQVSLGQVQQQQQQQQKQQQQEQQQQSQQQPHQPRQEQQEQQSQPQQQQQSQLLQQQQQQLLLQLHQQQQQQQQQQQPPPPPLLPPLQPEGPLVESFLGFEVLNADGGEEEHR